MTSLFLRAYLTITRKPMPFAGQRWYIRFGKINDPKAFATIIEPIFTSNYHCYCKKYFMYPGGKIIHSKNEMISIWDIIGSYKFVKAETVLFRSKRNWVATITESSLKIK